MPNLAWLVKALGSSYAARGRSRDRPLCYPPVAVALDWVETTEQANA